MDEVDLVEDVDTVGERKDRQEKRLFDKLIVTAFGEKQVEAVGLRTDLEVLEFLNAVHQPPNLTRQEQRVSGETVESLVVGRLPGGPGGHAGFKTPLADPV